MRSIKQIIREEINDFDWTKDVAPLPLGDEFQSDDLVFEDDPDYKINMFDNKVVVNLSKNHFIKDFMGYNEYCEFYLEPFLQYGPDYEPYDIDSEYDSYDERYVISYLHDEEKQQLTEMIKNNLGFKNFNIEDYVRDCSELNSFLQMLPITDWHDWDRFVTDLLSDVSYHINHNRWVSLGRLYEEKLNECEFEYLDYLNSNRSLVTITYRMNQINDDLTTTIYNSLKPISDVCWTEVWYDDYDVSGYEENVAGYFEYFYDNFETLYDDGELDILKEISKIGFNIELVLEKRGIKYEILEIDYSGEKVILAYNDNKVSIPIDELGEFIYNEKLDF